MQIKIGYPPNYQDIIEVFPEVKDNKRIVFTYSPNLYNPGGGNIPAHLEIHEQVHERQQGNDPKGWWNRYLKDPQFRLSQELEAYREQYDFAQKIVKDRNELARFLIRLADDLSSPTYGNVISKGQALELIKNG